MAVTINASTSAGLQITSDTSGTIAFQDDGTTNLTIDSSGKIGIGTTSAIACKLDVRNGSSAAIVALNTSDPVSGTCAPYLVHPAATGFSSTPSFCFWYQNAGIANPASETLGFVTNNSERIRITSGGEVYIAGTTDQGAYNLQCNGTGVWGAGAYTNGSDERIKDDIAPIVSCLDVVTKLKPITFKYKESWSKDQSVQTGFIAQDLLEAFDGEIYKDGIVQQGPEYMSVAYQSLIPILTKALQELKQENDDLKARVAALEKQ